MPKIEAKHTPGPWTRRAAHYIEAPGGVAVAIMTLADNQPSASNAALICAAPDLLAALQLLLQEAVGNVYSLAAIDGRIIKLADDAISKATGEWRCPKCGARALANDVGHPGHDYYLCERCKCWYDRSQPIDGEPPR